MCVGFDSAGDCGGAGFVVTVLCMVCTPPAFSLLSLRLSNFSFELFTIFDTSAIGEEAGWEWEREERRERARESWDMMEWSSSSFSSKKDPIVVSISSSSLLEILTKEMKQNL